MKKYIAMLWVCALTLGLVLFVVFGLDSGQTGQPPAAGPITPPAAQQPSEPSAPDVQPPADPTVPIDPGTNQPIPEDPQAIAFFDCGTLDIPNDAEPAGRENFAEFLNLTGVGKQAQIVLTQYTPAGDSIVSTLAFDGAAYTLAVNATADSTAAEGRAVTETTWQRLVIQEQRDGETLYQMFRLTNLPESEIPASAPDSADLYTLFREPIA